MTPKPTSPTAIELLQSQSLTTLVQHEIERQIMAGTLTPGTKPNEIEAAARLHLEAGLPHIAGDYMGEHWLATFAVLAIDETRS